jgi:hypothetical protein
MFESPVEMVDRNPIGPLGEAKVDNHAKLPRFGAADNYYDEEDEEVKSNYRYEMIGKKRFQVI